MPSTLAALPLTEEPPLALLLLLLMSRGWITGFGTFMMVEHILNKQIIDTSRPRRDKTISLSKVETTSLYEIK